MNSQSFKPKYYNNVFVGVVSLVLAAVVLLVKGNTSDKLIIFLCFGIIGLLMIIHTLTQRLTFTSEDIKITGIMPRNMNYQDIASIRRGKVMYKSGAGSGYASTINIISKKGKQLRLLPLKFANYEGEQGWAARLLNIIKEYSIEIDTELTKSLSKSASTKI